MRYAIRCDEGAFICCKACFDVINAQLGPDPDDVLTTEDEAPCMACEMNPVIAEANRKIVQRLADLAEAVLVLCDVTRTKDSTERKERWSALTDGAEITTKGLCDRARQLLTEASVLSVEVSR